MLFLKKNVEKLDFLVWNGYNLFLDLEAAFDFTSNSKNASRSYENKSGNYRSCLLKFCLFPLMRFAGKHLLLFEIHQFNSQAPLLNLYQGLQNAL